MSALEQGEDGGKDRRLVAACDVDDQTSWIVTMWGSWVHGEVQVGQVLRFLHLPGEAAAQLLGKFHFEIL